MKKKLADVITLEDLPEFYRDIAEEFGMEVVCYLAKKYGGTKRYFATLAKLEKERIRNPKVLQKCIGGNYRAIAKRCGLSERQVRRIKDGK